MTRSKFSILFTNLNNPIWPPRIKLETQRALASQNVGTNRRRSWKNAPFGSKFCIHFSFEQIKKYF